MVIGQNLQYEGRALFPVFIYLYNICTDFFFFLLKMKDDLTSGMPENIEVIVCLFFGVFFGIWGFLKNNNQKWNFLVLL